MARYEYCDVADIRGWMKKRLEKLPACKSDKETPEQFWVRVEQAGLLVEAIALYDEIAAEYAEWRHTARETKKRFDERMEREGRRAEAERLRTELLASGLTQRQAQAQLVERLQPLDGTTTRAWETPDPWENGRLFKKKADQEHISELLERDADEDYDQELEGAQDRMWWAEFRRDERQALAKARRRAQALRLEQQRLQSQQAGKAKSATNGYH